MSWYAAHLVLYVKYKEQPQAHFPLWENVVLVEAETEDEALAKAEQRGRADEGDCDGSFRWDGKPATWIFAGVRQLIRCEDESERPGDGTEVTYSEMAVDSLEELQHFVDGKTATVRYLEVDACED
jgi:uncharacterized protein DUF4288